MALKKGVVEVANAKIIEQKAAIVSEIKDKFAQAKSVVLFDARGLKVSEVNELRRALRESGSNYKVYKNTLTKRAVVESGLELESYLEGPTAISFSDDELAPVKIISEFAKTHEALELKAGIVEGKIANVEELNSYAQIPSRDGLLTMLAGGMIGVVRDLSICLDLYSKEKEEN
jgi:large subunit ribosomal protein L10